MSDARFRRVGVMVLMDDCFGRESTPKFFLPLPEAENMS
jgi:hypothetical protein